MIELSYHYSTTNYIEEIINLNKQMDRLKTKAAECQYKELTEQFMNKPNHIGMLMKFAKRSPH